MVSPRSSRNRAQVQAKSNKPVYTVDEPTLDELFPSKPGIYSMRDLNVDVLGFRLRTREELKNSKTVIVDHIINGQFSKPAKCGATYSIDGYHGKMWDSTYNRNQPLKVTIGEGAIFPGLEIALRETFEKSKVLAYIPPELAFGPLGMQGMVPPNAHVILWLVVESVREIGYEAFLRSIRSQSGANTAHFANGG